MIWDESNMLLIRSFYIIDFCFFCLFNKLLALRSNRFNKIPKKNLKNIYKKTSFYNIFNLALKNNNQKYKNF